MTTEIITALSVAITAIITSISAAIISINKAKRLAREIHVNASKLDAAHERVNNKLTKALDQIEVLKEVIAANSKKLDEVVNHKEKL